MKSIKFTMILTAFLLMFQIIFSDPVPGIGSEPGADPIVIYGDTRSNYQIHAEVVTAIVSVNPSVVFHTGDFVRHSSTQEQEWKKFMTLTENLRNNSEFFPVKGNHEVNSEYFDENFPFMEDEAWYSVDRNDIHFIVLDSNADLTNGEEPSEQYTWLINDLGNIPNNILFTIVLFHHPIFTTGPHSADEKNLSDILLPLFSEYGVDIVFNGHNHCYERSQYAGIYHIVAAGGGATLYDQMRYSKHSQLFLLEHHFCKLTIQNGQLVVDVIKPDLDTIDQIVIDSE